MGASHVTWGLQLFGGLDDNMQVRQSDKLAVTDMIQNRVRLSESMKQSGADWTERSNHVVNNFILGTARGCMAVLLGAYKFLHCMRSKTGARWGDIPGTHTHSHSHSHTHTQSHTHTHTYI